MKRFRKVYLEISNICNLRCSFCPGTKRAKKIMTPEEFTQLLPKLRPYTDYLYFHLMGEPLCHPNLKDYLLLAGDAGFKVILTTNGTLLAKQQNMLLTSPALHKVNISLHAFEANDLSVSFEEYLQDCFRFGQGTVQVIERTHCVQVLNGKCDFAHLISLDDVGECQNSWKLLLHFFRRCQCSVGEHIGLFACVLFDNFHKR